MSPNLTSDRSTEGTHVSCSVSCLFCCFLVLFVVFVFPRLIVLRLERKEGVRRQHVGVADETTFLTRQ